MKPSELAALLHSTIPARLPVLIAGAPGVGKSDIVAQAARAVGADLIIEHPVISDPTDFKGLPFVNGDHTAAEFLPFGNLQKWMDADRLTVVLADDLGQAMQSVQSAFMQPILAREIGGKKISDFVVFVAATNRRTDKANVQGILEPVKSRFCSIVTLEADREDWVKWAYGHDLPDVLVRFVRARWHKIENWTPTSDMVNTPSPRTLANLGKLVNLNLPDHIAFPAYSGAVGQELAAEFVGFVKLAAQLPSPDTILADPENAMVPQRADLLYFTAGMVAARCADSTWQAILKYAGRLPAEFSQFLVNDGLLAVKNRVLREAQKARGDQGYSEDKATPGDKAKATAAANALRETREYILWATDHQEVMI